MPGEPADQYIRARAALLDAADALAPHLESIVLVGAQAIYLHTGDADIAVQAFTTDADFTVEPAGLADAPLIGDILAANGFTRRVHPGGWVSPGGVYIDVMVPETLAGPGRRGANLGSHGRSAARRAKGLEGALVDFDQHTIHALDPTDRRSVTMKVAGPGALIVAKLHKIAERSAADDRLKDKDALDVWRILQAIPTNTLATSLTRLRGSSEAGPVTSEALEFLHNLFGTPAAAGILMATRATANIIDPAELSLAITTLTRLVISAISSS